MGITGIVYVLRRHSFDDFLDHLGIEIDQLFRSIDSCAAFRIDLAGFGVGHFHAEFSKHSQGRLMDGLDLVSTQWFDGRQAVANVFQGREVFSGTPAVRRFRRRLD